MAMILINGEAVAAKSGAQMPVINPATEEVVDTVPKAGPEDVDAAVSASRKAFPGWAKADAEERAHKIREGLAKVRAAVQEIADLLNGRGLVTGSGRPFTRQRVRSVREALGIPGLAGHLRATGWLSTGEVSDRLQVHPTTAIRCAAEGLLKARRADDKGTLLFAPLPEPLPDLQLRKQYRHRRPLKELAAQVRKDPQYAT